MTLKCLEASTSWDYPFFKVLSPTDTAEGKGKQAGIVILKDLRKFFPDLSGKASMLNPTPDHRVDVELFDQNKFLSYANARYQFQTWGGTRTPESRLTDNLGPIRSIARGKDILVIQRSTEVSICLD